MQRKNNKKKPLKQRQQQQIVLNRECPFISISFLVLLVNCEIYYESR